MKRKLALGVLIAATACYASAKSGAEANAQSETSAPANNSSDKAANGKQAADITTVAFVTRDKVTRQATLTSAINGPWKLYAGFSPDSINYDHPVITGDGKGQFSLHVDADKRSYFALVTTQGDAIIAETHLPMEGGYNFRDLGGIRTADGHHIRWDKLIRSDELGTLTDKDLTYLASFPLRTVVDFRRPDEIAKLPDRLPSTVKDYIALNITSANLKPGSTSKEDVRDWMIAINEELVTDKTIQNTYRDFFKLVQDESKLPLLFHCSAGKDRTGMGAALILYALGVDEETIFKEHMLSNKYLKEKYKPVIAAHPELQPQFEVQEAYFRKAFDRIKQDHGSVENYLINTLNVDIARMRQMYLSN